MEEEPAVIEPPVEVDVTPVEEPVEGPAPEGEEDVPPVIENIKAEKLEGPKIDEVRNGTEVRTQL